MQVLFEKYLNLAVEKDCILSYMIWNDNSYIFDGKWYLCVIFLQDNL